MSLTDDFKAALGSWATGVSVVTTNNGGMLYGLTVSSFSSLSLDPPLILVNLNNKNRLPEMIAKSQGFAVSMLADDQEAASRYFARAGRMPTPDFTEIPGEWTASGQPVVAGAVAWLVCGLHQTIAVGDHTIVVGQVLETRVYADRQPLVYFRRGYRTLVEGETT